MGIFSSFSMSCEGLFHALQPRALISCRGLDKNLPACCGNIWFFFGVLWGLFSRLQPFLVKIQGVYCIISWHARLCFILPYTVEMFKKFGDASKIQKFEVRSVFDSWFIIPTSRTSNIKKRKILKKIENLNFFKTVC